MRKQYLNLSRILDYIFIKTILLLAIFVLFTDYSYSSGSDKNSENTKIEKTHFTVTVLDKKNSQPLQLVNVKRTLYNHCICDKSNR